MRSRRIELGSVSFATAFGLFLLLPVVDNSDVTRFLTPIHWAVLCAAVGFVPVIVSARRRNFDLLAPIWLMMAYLGFLFGLRGVYLLESGAYGTLLRFTSPLIIARGLALATLAMLGIWVGYFSGFGERLGHALPRLRLLKSGGQKFPPAVIASAVGLGLSAYAVLSLSASRVMLSDVASEAGTFWLSPFQYLLPLSLCLIFLNSDRFTFTNVSAMLVVFCVICASWFFWFPSKSMLLRPLFYILVISHYTRRRLSMVTLAVLLCSFAIVRLTAFVENVLHWNVLALGGVLFSKFTSWGDLWQLFFSRFYDLDAFVVVLNYVQHTGRLLLGANYKELIYWYVPRWLWAGKPLTWSYRWGEIYDRYSAYEGHSFTATTLFGDFYLNFGVVGLLIGAPSVGIVARALYVYLIERIASKSAVLVYAVVLMHLLMRLSGAVPEAVAMPTTEIAPVCLVLAISRVVWLEREREELPWLTSAYPNVVRGRRSEQARSG